MQKTMVVFALGLKGARIKNLNAILIDGPAGIVEKDLIAEVELGRRRHQDDGVVERRDIFRNQGGNE